MRSATALVLVGALLTASSPAAAAPQRQAAGDSTPLDWARVQRIHSGQRVGIVDGRYQPHERYMLGTTDDDLHVLNLDAVKWSRAARKALLDLAADHPERLMFPPSNDRWVEGDLRGEGRTIYFQYRRVADRDALVGRALRQLANRTPAFFVNPAQTEMSLGQGIFVGPDGIVFSGRRVGALSAVVERLPRTRVLLVEDTSAARRVIRSAWITAVGIGGIAFLSALFQGT